MQTRRLFAPGVINAHNSANCSFATDDKLAGDLVTEGHIDHCVRKAIAAGLPPITTLQIATVNTARHYRLRNYGAIAPRHWADFIVFDDLNNLVVRQTYKKGELVAEAGRYLVPRTEPVMPPRSTMNVRYHAPDDFEVKANRAATNIKIIEVVPQQIVTRQVIADAKVVDEKVVPDVSRDILKLVVVERHRATGASWLHSVCPLPGWCPISRWTGSFKVWTHSTPPPVRWAAIWRRRS